MGLYLQLCRLITSLINSCKYLLFSKVWITCVYTYPEDDVEKEQEVLGNLRSTSQAGRAHCVVVSVLDLSSRTKDREYRT